MSVRELLRIAGSRLSAVDAEATVDTAVRAYALADDPAVQADAALAVARGTTALGLPADAIVWCDRVLAVAPGARAAPSCSWRRWWTTGSRYYRRRPPWYPAIRSRSPSSASRCTRRTATATRRRYWSARSRSAPPTGGPNGSSATCTPAPSAGRRPRSGT